MSLNQAAEVAPQRASAPARSADLALALSGGGARAAYQVGVLRTLARRRPDLQVPVLTGTSAGAINAIQLAGFRGTFAGAVEDLSALWRSIETARVYRTDLASLAAASFRWGANFLLGRSRAAPQTRGLVDTSPLRGFLATGLHARNGTLNGVAQNISDGRLRAVAITTTHYGTGRSITWVQGHPFEIWQRPQRASVATTIGLDHVMASAAVPFAFPAVQLDGGWHGDGGVRQIAPLSPALHLGASRIVTVSTRAHPRPIDQDESGPEPYPPPAQILSVLLNAVFLDMLDYDVMNLNRITSLVQALPGPAQGLRCARAFILRPSRDLGVLASEYEWRLPGALRFLLRRLGRRGVDLLSMILFEPAFIRRLLDLGESDAEEHARELDAFLADESLPA